MDLSALIFVALALAWAVYLVPKALKHHDEVQRSRSVERFSARMRVLARREPTGRRGARLVVTPFRQASAPRIETKAAAPGYSAATAPAAPAPSTPTASRPGTAALAARRRRRVLATLLLALAVVVGLAVGGIIAWGWVAAPGALVVAWLVACRLMVRRERTSVVRRPAATTPAASAPLEAEQGDEAAAALDDTQAAIPVVAQHPDQPEPQPEPQAPVAAPGQWDMVPMTLPTYVDKPAAARRTVHTIDLDSTGVWSSGRSERDSELARGAEEADRAARERARARRASGA